MASFFVLQGQHWVRQAEVLWVWSWSVSYYASLGLRDHWCAKSVSWSIAYLEWRWGFACPNQSPEMHKKTGQQLFLLLLSVTCVRVQYEGKFVMYLKFMITKPAGGRDLCTVARERSQRVVPYIMSCFLCGWPTDSRAGSPPSFARRGSFVCILLQW